MKNELTLIIIYLLYYYYCYYCWDFEQVNKNKKSKLFPKKLKNTQYVSHTFKQSSNFSYKKFSIIKFENEKQVQF
jgi:hypothetical protein